MTSVNQTKGIGTKWIFSLFLVSITSTNIIIGFSKDAEQDTWISLILSIFFIIPFVLIYSRLIKIMPSKNIFEMCEYALGKPLGKVIAFIFTLYTLLALSLTLFGYGAFTNISALRHTHFFIIVGLYLLPVLYLAKSGIDTLSKWSFIVLLGWLILMIVFSTISLSKADANNLFPMFTHSKEDIIKSAAKSAIIPAGEIVLTLGIANSFDKKAKMKKVYILTIITMTIYLMLVFFRTCALLGAETMSSVIFSNYKAMTVVKISDFFERVEAFLAGIYILAGITKCALLLTSFVNGIKSVFSFQKAGDILVPCAFLVLSLSVTPFDGYTEMFDFVRTVYVYISPLFQALIPIIIWIPAEIRYHQSKKKNPLAKIEEEINEMEPSI